MHTLWSKQNEKNTFSAKKNCVFFFFFCLMEENYPLIQGFSGPLVSNSTQVLVAKIQTYFYLPGTFNQ